jgi:hypothetical protein
VTRLEWFNRSLRTTVDFSARQRARIRALYASDFALLGQLKSMNAYTEKAEMVGTATK